jgi:hypothetical protein
MTWIKALCRLKKKRCAVWASGQNKQLIESAELAAKLAMCFDLILAFAKAARRIFQKRRTSGLGQPKKISQRAYRFRSCADDGIGQPARAAPRIRSTWRAALRRYKLIENDPGACFISIGRWGASFLRRVRRAAGAGVRLAKAKAKRKAK